MPESPKPESPNGPSSAEPALPPTEPASRPPEPAAPQPAPPSPLFRNAKEIAFVFSSSALLGILHALLRYDLAPGISSPLFAIGFLVWLRVCADVLGWKIGKDFRYAASGAVFASAFLAVRDGGALEFFNRLATLAFLLLASLLAVVPNLSGFRFRDYFPGFPRLVFRSGIGLLVWIGAAAGALRGARWESVGSDRARILKGVLLSVPLVFVFAALFASADPVFDRLVSDFFHLRFLDSLFQVPGWLGFAGFWTAGFVGLATSLTMRNRHSDTRKSAEFSYDAKRHVEINVVLGAVFGIFALFVLSQFSTMFAGEGAIRAGRTYAEYAKSGFGELTLASALVFVVAWFVDGYLYGHSRPSQSAAYRNLSLGIVGLSLVVLSSAFYRLWLYERAYGFTEDRFYGHVGIVLIGFSLCWLAFRTVRFVNEGAFLAGIVAIWFAGLAFCDFANPERIIASHNVGRSLGRVSDASGGAARPRSSSKLDYEYVGGRSADAVDVMIVAYRLASDTDRKVLTPRMCRLLRDIRDKDDVREWNFARYRALPGLSALEPELRCVPIPDYGNSFVP